MTTLTGMTFYEMASREFVHNFNIVATYLSCDDAEREAFKVLCRGNMDAATTFVRVVADRIRADPAHGINDRIRANIEREKQQKAQPPRRSS